MSKGFIQQVLEDEVVAFLGREKSQRRGQVDAQPGYRNGHGKPRRLTLSCGTITGAAAPGPQRSGAL